MMNMKVELEVLKTATRKWAILVMKEADYSNTQSTYQNSIHEQMLRIYVR